VHQWIFGFPARMCLLGSQTIWREESVGEHLVPLMVRWSAVGGTSIGDVQVAGGRRLPEQILVQDDAIWI